MTPVLFRPDIAIGARWFSLSVGSNAIVVMEASCVMSLWRQLPVAVERSMEQPIKRRKTGSTKSPHRATSQRLSGARKTWRRPDEACGAEPAAAAAGPAAGAGRHSRGRRRADALAHLESPRVGTVLGEVLGRGTMAVLIGESPRAGAMRSSPGPA